MTTAGIPLDQIVVLVATGLRRPNPGDDLAELVGDPWVLENVRVENHFAPQDEDHVDLGFTPGRKVPIKLDCRFVEADLKIATGLVEPHFMAGFSSGRKVVAPGIAHHETIRTFHSARFMEHPLARECNLEGNPLHEEQLEIVKRLGEVYALNTVVDDKRNLVFCSF
ncbi:lactate racemase domain-containing protein [Roseibium sp. SCP14]|uniref:lactate racemase domain-containing protein n=1 Tax=Roseibium sp. SCP14 TaxID=3141375 RepID=UPI00333C13AA